MDGAFRVFGYVADEEPVGPLLDGQLSEVSGHGAPIPISDRHIDTPDHFAIASPHVPQVTGSEDHGQRPGPQRPGLGRQVWVSTEDNGKAWGYHDGSAPLFAWDSRMERKQRRRASW